VIFKIIKKAKISSKVTSIGKEISKLDSFVKTIFKDSSKHGKRLELELGTTFESREKYRRTKPN
jgi:hypothetical protein